MSALDEVGPLDKTAREVRAAQLRRLEIDTLLAEYRRVYALGEGERPIHSAIREVLMRAILDREFGDDPDLRAKPGWF